MKNNCNTFAFRDLCCGIFISITLIFQSCTSVFTSSSYGNLKSYTPRPEYRGIDTSAYYAGARLSFGKHDREELDNDKKFMASIDVHRAITSKNYNFYYGLGGGYGSHKFSKDLIGGTYNVFNLNAKTGVNLTIPRERTDWRVLGVELNYHYEFGPYQNKLQEIKRNNPDFLVLNKRSIWSYNINSEVVFKLNNEKAIATQLFLGNVLNKLEIPEDYGSGFLGFGLNYRFKKYNLSFIHELGNEGIYSSKLSLSYQFR